MGPEYAPNFSGKSAKTSICFSMETRHVTYGYVDISSGWWLTYPSEKYESVGMMTFPIYGKIKHVPNHQPVMDVDVRSISFNLALCCPGTSTIIY